ncbi:TIGR03435 family protein [Silvibacterium sp.]|uniref:TIGR03435 family protein n=1 Tax=Silvibacterium sp. TaxID=1964179 RepID=UPI0039E22C08
MQGAMTGMAVRRLILGEAPWAAAILNHLWQSSAVFLAVWLLAVVLRNSRASVRYRLWVLASLKFLLPFAMLIDGVEWLRSVWTALRPLHLQHEALGAGMARLSMPFGPQRFIANADLASDGAGVLHQQVAMVAWLFAYVWLCGASIVILRYVRDWWHIRTLCRNSSPVAQLSGVPILSHEDSFEPGVVGILRPCILIPGNLFAEFPQAVLLAGGHPEIYAASILGVCRWYFELPATHMSGVAGADLKQRILRIMTGSIGVQMSRRAKASVAIAAMFALCFALAPGLFSDPLSATGQNDTSMVGLPRFAVVSIHPAQRSRGSSGFTPEGFYCEAESLKELIQLAYGIDKTYEMDRLPAWASSNRYAIEVKVDAPEIPALAKLGYRKRARMLQPVLLERFHLNAHWESRVLPVYLLTIAKGGSKLKAPSPDDAAHPPKIGDATGGPGSIIQGIDGRAIGQAVPIGMIAGILNAYTERLILDRTGLTGTYDFSIQLPRARQGPEGGYRVGSGSESMVPAEQAAEADPLNSASVFTAVADMGLELKPDKVPLQVLVIDSVQTPSDN